jgi:hypothetical protein
LPYVQDSSTPGAVFKQPSGAAIEADQLPHSQLSIPHSSSRDPTTPLQPGHPSHLLLKVDPDRTFSRPIALGLLFPVQAPQAGAPLSQLSSIRPRTITPFATSLQPYPKPGQWQATHRGFPRTVPGVWLITLPPLTLRQTGSHRTPFLGPRPCHPGRQRL